MIWNAPEWRIWTTHLRLFSQWLKEISDYWWSEMPHNEAALHRLFSPRLNKILDFNDLKYLRMKNLDSLSQSNFIKRNLGSEWSEMVWYWCAENEQWENIRDCFYKTRKWTGSVRQRLVSIYSAPVQVIMGVGASGCTNSSFFRFFWVHQCTDRGLLCAGCTGANWHSAPD